MNIKASSILSKYIGESDKMVSAIFRLGRKLAPTVIFIDEIDTVLRKRSSFDNSGGAVQSMQVRRCKRLECLSAWCGRSNPM
jgi:ATP-dependent 26S proteasome regulatory subunit